MLKRLPTWTKTIPTQEQADKINSSFMELLESLIYPNKDKFSILKKNRFDIAPGKSDTGNNLTSQNPIDSIIEDVIQTATQNFEMDEINANTNSLKRKQFQHKISSNSGSDPSEFSIHNSSSDYETLEEILSQKPAIPLVILPWLNSDRKQKNP